MQNPYAMTNGKNPDTIEEMYENFKKTVGTFNTLVTIRDYNNKLMDSEVVGNGFVCDRTNDLQRCYSIVHTDDGYTRKLKKMEGDPTSPAISAYDLKLYLIQPVNLTQTAQSYKTSFEFVDNFDEETFNDGESFDEAKSNLVGKTVEEFEENKCISQDFTSVERYKPLYFKNKYPINCSIIPIAKLSDKEIAEIKRNVALALYEKFNGNVVKFGQEIDYDEVYNTILNADSRISAIHLQDIVYTTYAVYRGSQSGDGTDEYKEVIVNRFYQPINTNISFEGAVQAGGKLLKSDQVPADASLFGFNDVVCNLAASNDFDKYYYKYYSDPSIIMKVVDRYQGFQGYQYPFGTSFATDIYAKSVLNGNTPLIKKDETFTRSINQKYDSVSGANKVYYLSTESEMTFSNNTYQVQKNENLQIFSPSYATNRTYAFGTKMQYILNDSIPADADYRLKSGEEMLMIWRSTDDASYQWQYYMEGDIVKSSRGLTSEHNAELFSAHDSSYTYDISTGHKCGPWLGDLLNASETHRSGTIPDTLQLQDPSNHYPIIKYNSSTTYNDPNATTPNPLTTVVDFIGKLQFSQDSLMANDTIEDKQQVKLDLDNTFNYFWILNKFEPDSDSSTGYSCVLFEQGEDEYTLGNDEYFYYCNKEGTAMYQLGAGTKLTRDLSIWNSRWACDRIDIIDYFNQTDAERASYWKSISRNCVVTAYEQTISSFGEGTIVQWQYSGAQTMPSTITSTPQDLPDDATVTVLYKENQYDAWTPLVLPSGNQEIKNTVRSALQLICTNNVAQQLIHTSQCNQKILISSDPDSATTLTEISSDEGAPDSNDWVNILSNRDCDYEGTGVNVQAIDAFNNRSPLQLYPYTSADAESASNYIVDANGNIHFGFSNNSPVSIDTCLQKGEYLMPFKYTCSNDSQRITIEKEGVALKDLYGISSFESGKQYYIRVSITAGEEASGVTFLFTRTSNSDAVSCTIGELIKYGMPDGLKGSSDDEASAEWYVVLQRMQELDPNHEFDFNYTIPNVDLIENPLEAMSFNDSHHIMNPFTICEMDIDAMGDNFDTIRILNNVR